MVASENDQKWGSLFRNFKINFSIESQNVLQGVFSFGDAEIRQMQDPCIVNKVSFFFFGLRALTDVFCKYFHIPLSAVVQMVPPWDWPEGRATCVAAVAVLHQPPESEGPLGGGGPAWPCPLKVVLIVPCVQRVWCNMVCTTPGPPTPPPRGITLQGHGQVMEADRSITAFQRLGFIVILGNQWNR